MQSKQIQRSFPTLSSRDIAIYSILSLVNWWTSSSRSYCLICFTRMARVLLYEDICQWTMKRFSWKGKKYIYVEQVLTFVCWRFCRIVRQKSIIAVDKPYAKPSVVVFQHSNVPSSVLQFRLIIHQRRRKKDHCSSINFSSLTCISNRIDFVEHMLYKEQRWILDRFHWIDSFDLEMKETFFSSCCCWCFDNNWNMKIQLIYLYLFLFRIDSNQN